MSVATDVNPNVEVSGKGEAIQITGDMSMVSFDELDNAQVGAPSEEVSSKDGTSFSEKAQPVETKEDRSSDGSEDEIDDEARDPATHRSAKPAGTQEDQVEGEKEDPEDETLSGEHELDQDKQAAVFAKGKLGDQEYEVPAEAIFQTKVAGKIEDVTLQELQKNYSGSVNWDRKYQEVAELKKTQDARQTDLNNQATNLSGVVNDFLEAADDTPTKMFDVIAGLTKQDAVQLKMSFWDSLANQAKQLAQMDDDDLALARKKAEVGFREESVMSQQKRMDQATQKTSDQTKAQEVMDNYKMTQEEYKDCLTQAGELVRDRKPDGVDVVTVHRHLMVTQMVDEVNPDFANDPKYDRVVSFLRDNAVNTPSFTKEDLKEMFVSAGYAKGESSDEGSTDRSARLSKKARRTAGVTNSAHKKAPTNEPLTFEDLDDEDGW